MIEVMCFGEFVEGEYIYNKETGTIQLILFCDEETYSKIPNQIDCIYGKLTNSASVTLVDCEILGTHSPNFINYNVFISCQYMIDGRKFTKKNDILFDRFRYELSGTIEWSGLGGFEFPKNTQYTHTVAYKKNDWIVSQIGCDTVSFIPELGTHNFESSIPEYVLNQRVQIELAYKSPTSLDKSIADIKKIIGLISIGIKRIPQINCLKVFSSNYYTLFGEKKIEIPISVYNDTIKLSRTEEPKESELTFKLGDLYISEKDLLQKWFESYEIVEPIIELYLWVKSYKNISAERTFLNLTQALEAYHRRFVCNKKNKYKKHLTRQYSKVKNGKQIVEAIFTKDQEKKGDIFFRSRMIELLFNNIEIDFIKNSFSSKIKFIEKIVKTRNYHTHYFEKNKEESFTKKELEYVNEVLERMIEYYLLEVIGIEKKEPYRSRQELEIISDKIEAALR